MTLTRMWLTTRRAPTHTAGYGFIHDARATTALRKRAIGYFKHNLNVFRRPPARGGGARSQQLAGTTHVHGLLDAEPPDYDHAEHSVRYHHALASMIAAELEAEPRAMETSAAPHATSSSSQLASGGARSSGARSSGAREFMLASLRENLESMGSALSEMADEADGVGREERERLYVERQREEAVLAWEAMGRAGWERHELTNCFTAAACPSKMNPRGCTLETRKLNPWKGGDRPRMRDPTPSYDVARNLTDYICARLCEVRRGCGAFTVSRLVLSPATAGLMGSARPAICYLRTPVETVTACKYNESAKFDTYIRRRVSRSSSSSPQLSVGGQQHVHHRGLGSKRPGKAKSRGPPRPAAS